MSDLISRQAAIDLLKQMRKDGDMIPWEGKDVFARIRKLPSVQSEIVRCKDCKYAEYIDDVKTLWCTECGQDRTARALQGGDGMKYSDGFYQDLTLIRPSTPKRSTHQVEALIEKYDLCETEINDDFLRGFEYAVTIIGERLREERE